MSLQTSVKHVVARSISDTSAPPPLLSGAMVERLRRLPLPRDLLVANDVMTA
jgi:hypothetical protein